MMKYPLFAIMILMLACFATLQAQPQEAPNNPNNTVSISSQLHINDAIQILENFSLRQKKKKILNLSSFNSPINIPISSLPWDRALELIALQNNLLIKEYPGYIAIENYPVKEEVATPLPPLVSEAKDKQVRIKAVAMLADRSYLKSLGVDWSSVFDGEVTINAGFAGASQLTSPMTLSGSGSTDIGNFRVDINTLLKTVETNQKGTILAEPTIMVSSGKQGYIQVGQDISIKTADEAGNTTDAFFATGVIMDVVPTVVVVDGQEVIHLKLSIERSSGVPSAVSTVISKSKSTTEIYLYDNEETVIGGLFDTDETKVRSGIPILKDLPWWFFGIRYLTGYNTVDKKERELVITIKAEIVDNALERMMKAKAQQ